MCHFQKGNLKGDGGSISYGQCKYGASNYSTFSFILIVLNENEQSSLPSADNFSCVLLSKL